MYGSLRSSLRVILISAPWSRNQSKLYSIIKRKRSFTEYSAHQRGQVSSKAIAVTHE